MLFSIDFDEPLPGAFKAKWCNLVESILLNTELVSILIPVCYVNLPFTFLNIQRTSFLLMLHIRQLCSGFLKMYNISRSSCQFNSWIEDNRPPSIQCDTISRIELFAGVCVTRLKDTIMLHTHWIYQDYVYWKWGCTWLYK